jgi:quercetin dioxygenase-like cupin family protein
MKSIVLLITLTVAAIVSNNALANGAKVTPLMLKALMDLPSKEVQMLTVEYPPGGETVAHRHDAHIFVYVLEGSVMMQVKGSAPVTLVAGEVFYEAPEDIHVLSKNASDSEHTKFLVVSFKDKAVPLLLPVEP